MLFHKLISTAFGLGYIGRGAGSCAAAVTCACWYFFQSQYTNPLLWPLLITEIIIVLGILSADKVEESWGKDHQRVVVDEVAGMCITLLFVPLKPVYLVIGFLLFRVLDICKPLYIRRMEKLPGGWGVMADDILAGIYANAILQLFICYKLI